MLTRWMKRCALCAFLAGTGLAAASQPADASEAVDSCSATCPGGSCSASTAWYVFWDDCMCSCTGDGRPTCSCS